MNKEEFHKNIKNWLYKSGYDLEMKVAQKFSNADFHISQPYFYEDLNTKKIREIDIWSSKSKKQNNINVRINYIIECKNAKQKPWVVFKSDHRSKFFQDPRAEMSHYIRPGTIAGQFFLLTYQQLIEKSLPTFEIPDFLGYGISEAFKDSESDKAYEAITQVLNATNSLKNKFNTSYENAEIFYPIVVIDGILMEVKLNDQEEIDLSEVESTTLLYENKILDHNSGFSFIKIVPLKYLNKFLSELDLLFEELFEKNPKVFDFVTNKDKKNGLKVT